MTKHHVLCRIPLTVIQDTTPEEHLRFENSLRDLVGDIRMWKEESFDDEHIELCCEVGACRPTVNTDRHVLDLGKHYRVLVTPSHRQESQPSRKALLLL